MENHRRNPEMIFLAVTEMMVEELEQQFENALDRWELKRLVPLAFNEVREQVLQAEKGFRSELRNHFLIGYMVDISLYSNGRNESIE